MLVRERGIICQDSHFSSQLLLKLVGHLFGEAVAERFCGSVSAEILERKNKHYAREFIVSWRRILMARCGEDGNDGKHQNRGGGHDVSPIFFFERASGNSEELRINVLRAGGDLERRTRIAIFGNRRKIGNVGGIWLDAAN